MTGDPLDAIMARDRGYIQTLGELQAQGVHPADQRRLRAKLENQTLLWRAIAHDCRGLDIGDPFAYDAVADECMRAVQAWRVGNG